MEIVNYFECDNREHWLGEIKRGDWGAIPTLAGFPENGTFFENLGDGILLLLTDGDKLVSFVTFARNDCIDDKSLYPWKGFDIKCFSIIIQARRQVNCIDIPKKKLRQWTRM